MAQSSLFIIAVTNQTEKKKMAQISIFIIAVTNQTEKKKKKMAQPLRVHHSPLQIKQRRRRWLRVQFSS